MSEITKVAGLDGTRAGWVAVTWAGPGTTAEAEQVSDLREFVSQHAPNGPIAIDIPIGFLDAAERGGRECDRSVRRTLGQPRGSSVFPAPVRRVLSAGSYTEAGTINRASSPHNIGISQQSFALCPKLREVDELMTPDLQENVYEAHPEYSFYLMADRQPMKHNKKKLPGRTERLGLLVGAGFLNAQQLVDQRREYRAAADDVVDAMAMAWTAWRIANGNANCQPSVHEVPIDAHHLKMQIWG